MADISPQSPGFQGADLSFASASSGGDALVMTGAVVLLVENTSGSPVDVNLTSQATPGAGEDAADEVLSVGANATGAFALRRTEVRGLLDTDGKIQLTYGDNTVLNVAAVDVS